MTRRRLGAIALVPITAIAVAFAGGLVAGPAVADANSAHGGHGATANRVAFHDVMRKLWEDHVTWTRLFIVSAATESGNLPDIGPTVDRLLANQTDIGDAIKPFYGDAAGNQLTDLLRDHILTAAELVAAAKAGDSSAVADASARWHANADDIATFLANANPKQWPLADMKAMMKDHLDLTLKEAVARLDGRYADDITAYDEVHAEILQMADMLSDGIVAQFPSRFAH
jgi:hypothetical protein